MNNFLEQRFRLKETGTTVRTEVIAGLTTFMTMAYILAVNPNILGASGMDTGAVFTATCLASALGSILMALLANYPFALHILHIQLYLATATAGKQRWRLFL